MADPPGAVLRAYVEAHHRPGDAYTIPTDYGAGVEHGLACICGGDWGEGIRNDGCAERLALLAIADQIDANADESRVRAQVAGQILDYPGPDPSPASSVWWAGYGEAQRDAAQIARGSAAPSSNGVRASGCAATDAPPLAGWLVLAVLGAPDALAAAVAPAVLRAVAQVARACSACGQVHQPRPSPLGEGVAPDWAAEDGHPYRAPELAHAHWLEGIAERIEETSRD